MFAVYLFSFIFHQLFFIKFHPVLRFFFQQINLTVLFALDNVFLLLRSPLLLLLLLLFKLLLFELLLPADVVAVVVPVVVVVVAVVVRANCDAASVEPSLSS